MKSQVAGTKGPVTFPEEKKPSKNNKDVDVNSLKELLTQHNIQFAW